MWLNAYKERILSLEGMNKEVTIDRRDVPQLTGKVVGLEGEGGFYLGHYQVGQRGEYQRTLIAYDDVRGITEQYEDPDMH